jgi:hypothetical protein
MRARDRGGGGNSAITAYRLLSAVSVGPPLADRVYVEGLRRGPSTHEQKITFIRAQIAHCTARFT